MQVLRPIGFNGVTTAAPTLTLPKWTPWMVAAAHFNPCGVICCRNMWQRMPLVKNDSEKDAQQPGFESWRSLQTLVPKYLFSTGCR